LYKATKNANDLTKATGCKGACSLMDLPSHDSIQQTVPDAMHTIKDVIVNLYDLITGKVDIISCRQCEMDLGRFGITRIEKIDHKNPGVPYRLSSFEIKQADMRTESITTPHHIDFAPHRIFSKTSNLKSHDCKQVKFLDTCVANALFLNKTNGDSWDFKVLSPWISRGLPKGK